MSKHAPLLLTVLLAACGGPPAVSEPVTGGTLLAPQDIALVTREAISAGPRVSGSLEAAEKAVIRSEAGGSVLQVEVEVGQRVRRGDVLARIEGTVARESSAGASAGVTAAEQDVLNATREVERVGRLVAVGALAARDQEMAESGLISARARLKDARARSAGAQDQLSGATVRAPIDGVVSERSVNLGDIVAPGAPLFVVLEPSSLRLSGAVPAEAVASLKVGAAVSLEVQGHLGVRYAGVIERIAPAVDPVTRQIPILVTIPNAEGELMAGLFAEGRVAAEVHDGLVVPADALLGSTASTVRRVNGGKVEDVPVTVGIRDADADRVEVTGVQAGDTVLVGPARQLPIGTAVKLPGAATSSTPAIPTASEG